MSQPGRGALPPIAIQPLDEGDPREFGDFRVIGRLGAGGMGEAFLAEGPDTWLVVKTIRAGSPDSAELAARMSHEVEAMLRVNSPLVARIIASELDAPRPWFAMEFVPGLNLGQRVSQFGPVPPAELPALALGLARCLEAIDEAGVVHRDLKPDNVVLDTAGPRLIDFGTAEVGGATNLTAVGNVVGTMLWMAPEQVSGAETTAAADVHAWGLLMIFAASGEVPFAAETSVATMYRALNYNPPIPPALGEPIGGLVARALAKDPAQRPHAAELVRDISEAMGVAMTAGMSPAYPLPLNPQAGPAGAGTWQAGTWQAGTDPNRGYPQQPGYQHGQPGYGATPPGGYPGAGYSSTPPAGTPLPGYGSTPPAGTPVPGYGQTPPGGYPGPGTSGPNPVAGRGAAANYSAQTDPNQPAYGYAQPGYAQPGYGQAGYPPPGSAAPPAKKGHKGLLVLLALIPLVAAVGLGGWWFLLREDSADSSTAAPTSDSQGTLENSAHPKQVLMTDGLKGDSVTRISVGDTSACVVADNGRAYCWGSNSDGQLGSSGEGSDQPRAVDRSGALKGRVIERLSVGGRHACVLDDQGQAYCWGANDKGQLGTAQTLERSDLAVPVDTSGALAYKKLVRIGATNDTTCASDTEGRLYCWGSNEFGQFGNGTTTSSPQPVAADTSTGLSGVTAFSVGDDHSCAVVKEGTAYCWGSNEKGQLGNGTTAPSLVPASVQVTSDPTFAFASISVGGASSCAYGQDGSVMCWGAGGQGQLGTGSTLDTPNPTYVVFGPDLNATAIQAINDGGNSVCAVAEDGQAFCWGAGESGQLGNGKKENSLVPVAVSAKKSSDLPLFSRIGTGQATACAFAEDGSAWCWGSNENGMLGAGLAYPEK